MDIRSDYQITIDTRTYPVFVLKNTKTKPNIGKYKCPVCNRYHKHGFKSGHRCQHCHQVDSNDFYKNGVIVLTDVAHINDIKQLKNHGDLLIYTLYDQKNIYAVAVNWFSRHMNTEKYIGKLINKKLFLEMNEDYNNRPSKEKSKRYTRSNIYLKYTEKQLE